MVAENIDFDTLFPFNWNEEVTEAPGVAAGLDRLAVELFKRFPEDIDLDTSDQIALGGTAEYLWDAENDKPNIARTAEVIFWTDTFGTTEHETVQTFRTRAFHLQMRSHLRRYKQTSAN